MSIFDWLLGFYLAKKAQNATSRPIIIAPEGYDIVGMRPKGMRDWEIRYRRKGDSGSSGHFMVDRKTVKVSGPGGKNFEVFWSRGELTQLKGETR